MTDETTPIETVTTTAEAAPSVAHGAVEIEQSVRDHLVSTAQALHAKLEELEASPELASAKASLENAIHNISAHFASKPAAAAPKV